MSGQECIAGFWAAPRMPVPGGWHVACGDQRPVPQNVCPNSVTYGRQLDASIDADAAAFGVLTARVFTAFGGTTTPNPYIRSYI